MEEPRTLIFAFTSREITADHELVFADFRDHLARATGKRVIHLGGHSRTADVEAMRAGRMHIASFPAGFTGFAVNLAGFVPFAAMGGKDGFKGNDYRLIVKKDSPYRAPSDLKGKRVAHSTPLSNSGGLYPRVFLSKEGLVPGQDYTIVYSGDHDLSIFAVDSGATDGAFVASDILAKTCARKLADCDGFRAIYRTGKFPPPAFGIVHDLLPDLAAKIEQAFMDYRFTPEMTKQFASADRFVAIAYRKDWAVIRKIAEAEGESYSRADFEKRKAQEAEAARKRQESEKQTKK